MMEIGAIKNKEWIKNVTVNNRNFKITFYRDEWNFLWFRIEEIYRPKKNFFDFSWKKRNLLLLDRERRNYYRTSIS
jgi:hypothetical protein